MDLLNFLISKIPPMSTSSKAIQVILDILERSKFIFHPAQKVFLDLGCGRGKVLKAVKKKYPEMEVIGYENWPNQFLLTKLSAFFSKTKFKVFYKDLFSADLKKADIVYCYLFPSLLTKMEKKMEAELKNGTLVISNTFPFPSWKPSQVIITNHKNPNLKKIFIYVMKKND